MSHCRTRPQPNGDKMKKLTLLTALLLSTSAYATDLPHVVVPNATPSWSGFYVGALAGYGWGTTDNSASYDVYSASLGTNPKGALAGGFAGYNFQFGSWVAGLEADMAWANLKGSSDLSGKLGTVPFTVRADNHLDWLGTARARIGYAFGPALLYGTAGAAYGAVNSDYRACIGCSSLNSSFAQTYSTSHNQLGWTAGAGLEYMIGRVTARMEYMYYDMGRTTDNIDGVNVSSSHNGHIGRVGVGWRF